VKEHEFLFDQAGSLCISNFLTLSERQLSVSGLLVSRFFCTASESLFDIPGTYDCRSSAQEGWLIRPGAKDTVFLYSIDKQDSYKDTSYILPSSHHSFDLFMATTRCNQSPVTPLVTIFSYMISHSTVVER
jgi:hypothetical protein